MLRKIDWSRKKREFRESLWHSITYHIGLKRCIDFILFSFFVRLRRSKTRKLEMSLKMNNNGFCFDSKVNETVSIRYKIIILHKRRDSVTVSMILFLFHFQHKILFRFIINYCLSVHWHCILMRCKWFKYLCNLIESLRMLFAFGPNSVQSSNVSEHNNRLCFEWGSEQFLGRHFV